MAVYQVFGDKGGLVREMFLAGFERLATAFAAVPHTSDPIADLLVLGHAYRANALANPHLYELMFGRPFPEFQPDAEAAAQIQPTFDMLIAAVARCVREEAFALAEPADLAVGINALAHGLCSLDLRGALGDATEARACRGDLSRAPRRGDRRTDRRAGSRVPGRARRGVTGRP
ncbi:TetR-like C-terminal domain-containing protein [Nonomuraea wenchangensis]|uniref:TetR-like C-terminal domain-containing protein n=1 Tax=Nonomuraea wenchangensis TaxID=568860 RepID=UPI00342ADD8B